jgi:hypothetical protein
MQDQEYIAQFEQCTLPKENFKHRGHIRIAWIYLSQHPFPDAMQQIKVGIQRYAASLGASQIYHETMTQAWARIIHASMRNTHAESFDKFIHLHPELLNSKLINEYYSPQQLATTEAKLQWIEPDLKSF